jgi:glycerol-3-phosphate dehydrogenase
VLGGKITTYRQLAEEVIDQLKKFYPHLENSSTKNTPLPGARLDSMDFAGYCLYAKKHYYWLSDKLLNRYLNNYGTNTELLLSQCTNKNSMGKHFGAELYEAELNYLITYEWAQNAEDVLFRRTKLGLVISDVERQEIEAYISSKLKISELA